MQQRIGKPFEPGRSGNPGGRPKGIAAKAREHADRAIDVLVEALADDDTKTRIAAARELLDRGFGKPVTMTADLTNRLDEFDDSSLDAAIAAVRSALGGAETDGSGEASATSH